MADFNEIADEFRDLVSQLQKNPAQLISEESVEFATDTVKKLQQRTVEQQKFINMLGEEELVQRRIALERERSAATTDAARARITEDIELNKQLENRLEELTQQYGEMTGHIKMMSDDEKRILEIEVEKQKILQTHTQLSLDEKFIALDRLAIEEKFRNQIVEVTKKMEMENKLTQMQEQYLGFSTKSIKDKFRDIGSTLTSTAGRLTVIAGALKHLFTLATDQLRELRDTGLSINQTFEAGGQIIRRSFGGGIGAALQMGATVKAVGALRSEFGDLSFQTDATVRNVSNLHTFFRLSSEEAGHLVEDLTKQAGMSAEAQDNFFRSVKAFAEINRLNPAHMIDAVAKHAQIFAQYGAEGAAAFFRSAAAAERIGISLEEIDKLGDTLVDIDSMFQNISRLRTLGINIANPTQLAQVAQFGTQEDIVNELRRQLGNVDIAKLGRVQRNLLAQTFGLDLATLERVQTGGGAAGTEGAAARAQGIADATEQQVKTMGDFDHGMEGALAVADEFTRSLHFSTIALYAMAAAAAANTLLGGGGKLIGLAGKAGGLLGGVGRATGAARMLGGAGGAAGTAGQLGLFGAGGAAGGAGMLGTAGTALGVGGLVATAALGGVGIGEEINKLTGTATLSDMWKRHKAIREEEVRGQKAETELRMLREITAPMHAVNAAAAAQREQAATADQMDELIGLMKKGYDVKIDGKKAGKFIANAQGRALGS